MAQRVDRLAAKDPPKRGTDACANLMFSKSNIPASAAKRMSYGEAAGMGVEGKEGILREQVTRARHVCFGRVSGLKPLNGVTFNLPSASGLNVSTKQSLRTILRSD